MLSNLKFLKSIYSKSPRLLKELYSLIPWKIRMGSGYRRTLGFLLKSEKWSVDQWHSYQTSELRSLLKFCSKEVPYYRELFKKNQIDVDCDDIWSEFYKIPLMTKEDLIKNNDKLIPDNRKGLFSLATGGTTGKPVTIFYDKESYKKEWAFKIFFWGNAIGYKISDKKATFRGVSFGAKLFHKNPIYNEIRFSPFKLEGSDTQKIVNKLKEYKPRYIHGYPSAIEQLARYLVDHNERLEEIAGIILISENIFDYQISLMKETFDCPIYSFYGLTERVIMASMNENLDLFYAHPAYGITEIVDTKTNLPVSKLDVLGELVGTGFINYGMPLLRYKTADFSSWKMAISDASWSMPTLGTIKGRWNQEFLIGKDRSKVSLTALNMHSSIYANIDKLQFYQEEFGTIQLNVVKSCNYSKDDEKSIREKIMRKLGSQFLVKFNYVHSLSLTQSGKAKYLVQKLDI